jgi:hypothetical protein
MTTFDERERQEETRYKLEQELRFKIRSRRNKQLGTWLALERLGLDGEGATAFAKTVVLDAFDHPGDAAFVDHVLALAAERGVTLDRAELVEKLGELEEAVRKEVLPS